MAFEVPVDLINQIQISLREESGFASYDPTDPSIPSLPSLDESIAGFDPSPPYLRCKHCKARLLRDLQSIICIYCGEEQRKDIAPDPISFKSTFGYRWLLESLDVDGSETVGPSIEASELNRGKVNPKNEISLSTLLDLQLNWPEESERIGTSVSFQEPSTPSSLKFVGVDLDNFYQETKGESGSKSEKHLVQNKQVVASDSSLSLFENVQPSESEASTIKDKNADSFSGWDAEFHSSSIETVQVGPTSADTFAGVDLSAQIDTVFGPIKELPDGKSKSVDFIEGDLWKSSSVKTHDNNIVNEDDDSFDTWNDFTSTTTAQDDHWKSTITKTPGNETVSEDDSFGAWNDFTNPTTVQDASRSFQYPSGEERSDSNLFSPSEDLEEMDFGSFSKTDIFLGAKSKNNGSTAVDNTHSEASGSDRGADLGVGINEEDAGKVDDASKGTMTSKANEVEILMSQMHDLSFMLEDNLSIPSKLEGYNSFSNDN